jgi:hypothetical protein
MALEGDDLTAPAQAVLELVQERTLANSHVADECDVPLFELAEDAGEIFLAPVEVPWMIDGGTHDVGVLGHEGDRERLGVLVAALETGGEGEQPLPGTWDLELELEGGGAGCVPSPAESHPRRRETLGTQVEDGGELHSGRQSGPFQEEGEGGPLSSPAQPEGHGGEGQGEGGRGLGRRRRGPESTPHIPAADEALAFALGEEGGVTGRVVVEPQLLHVDGPARECLSYELRALEEGPPE